MNFITFINPTTNSTWNFTFWILIGWTHVQTRHSCNSSVPRFSTPRNKSVRFGFIHPGSNRSGSIVFRKPLHKSSSSHLDLSASSPLRPPPHRPRSPPAMAASPEPTPSVNLRSAFGGVFGFLILVLIGVLAFSIRIFSVSLPHASLPFPSIIDLIYCYSSFTGLMFLDFLLLVGGFV